MERIGQKIGKTRLFYILAAVLLFCGSCLLSIPVSLGDFPSKGAVIVAGWAYSFLGVALAAFCFVRIRILKRRLYT